MSDKRIRFYGFDGGAILLLFLVFWWMSGWYRIDCALHVQKACDLIANEYEAKAKP